MQYYRFLTLKDGTPCLLRQLVAEDGQAEYDLFSLTHSQSPYLTSYPDENSHTPEEESESLAKIEKDPISLALGAFVDSRLVGSASVEPVRRRSKTIHRCRIGVSIDEAFCSNGIGRALMESAVACAREVGFYQAELDVAAENERALGLYRKLGFVEFGRNPYEWMTRKGQWQEVIYMRLPLQENM